MRNPLPFAGTITLASSVLTISRAVTLNDRFLLNNQCDLKHFHTRWLNGSNISDNGVVVAGSLIEKAGSAMSIEHEVMSGGRPRFYHRYSMKHASIVCILIFSFCFIAFHLNIRLNKIYKRGVLEKKSIN